MISGLIVLSAIVGIGLSLWRRRAKRTQSPQNVSRERLPFSSPLALAVATAAVGYLISRIAGKNAVEKCADEQQSGYRKCVKYEDQGYNACSKYADQGYNACSKYEDRGYNACNQWDKKCCTWWPCSWACKLITWVCRAWVWVSKWVCVAWYWVSKWVCVAWYWVTKWVCVAWTWINFSVCVTSCILRRLFATNEVSESKSECSYGWTAAYRISEERDCVLAVVERIRLQPDAGVTPQQLQAAQATWEQAIEQAWTDRFRVRRLNGNCPCAEYRVTLDVQWVSSGEHHAVQVHAGSGRADMGNWFITDSGLTTAHEVGHMLGNVDEYPDPNCPNRVVSNDNSIMGTGQNVRPRHYQTFADWISARTCCDYEVASA